MLAARYAVDGVNVDVIGYQWWIYWPMRFDEREDGWEAEGGGETTAMEGIVNGEAHGLIGTSSCVCAGLGYTPGADDGWSSMGGRRGFPFVTLFCLWCPLTT